MATVAAAAATTDAPATANSVRDSIALPARPDGALPVYVDYNATTPLSESVCAAMQPFLVSGVSAATAGLFGNASSSHWYGAAAKQALEGARASVARCINASHPSEIVFLSGATESLNYALSGGAHAQRSRTQGRNHVLSCAVEHVATLAILERLREEGFEVSILPVDASGRVSAQQVREALRPSTILVSLMLANNEVGSVLPLSEICSGVRSHPHGEDIWIHTDASQALGKIPVDVQSLGVDLLTIAGHKIYASKGVGALYIRQGRVQAQGGLRKFMVGANHELDRRAGTENTMLIAGLGAACAAFDSSQKLQPLMRSFESMRDELYTAIVDCLRREIPKQGLRDMYTVEGMDTATQAVATTAAAAAAGSSSSSSSPAASAPRLAFVLHASPQHRLSNTLSIGFLHINASALLHNLQAHVAASAGAACHASTVHLSYVLKAMGVAPEYGMGTLRLSVGRYNHIEELRQVGEWIGRAVVSMWMQQKSNREQAEQAKLDASNYHTMQPKQVEPQEAKDGRAV